MIPKRRKLMLTRTQDEQGRPYTCFLPLRRDRKKVVKDTSKRLVCYACIHVGFHRTCQTIWYVPDSVQCHRAGGRVVVGECFRSWSYKRETPKANGGAENFGSGKGLEKWIK
ncbi:hypothetical protein VNO78_03534 [Psophocarpus tetragonolobus]|uniref:Uncharacterized protein n=1 Tax=Psophocarpus tetragonolobus TaxID=3891 RepID=A0AAN9T4H8_PSOTE